MTGSFVAWLLGNPTILAIGGALLAALGWGFHQRLAGAKAERNRNQAEKADAYEKHLKEIGDAARARDAVDPRGMPDDPYRRD